MKRMHIVAGLLVWPFVTVFGGWLFLHTGPAMELRLAPVLIEQRIGDVERIGNRVCWTWSYIKARPAVPQTFAWSFTVNNTAIRVPAVAVRATDKSPLGSARTRPPGRGDIELCASIPDDLDDIVGLSIPGWAEYETNHNFWTLWQAIPAVIVPEPAKAAAP